MFTESICGLALWHLTLSTRLSKGYSHISILEPDVADERFVCNPQSDNWRKEERSSINNWHPPWVNEQNCWTVALDKWNMPWEYAVQSLSRRYWGLRTSWSFCEIGSMPGALITNFCCITCCFDSFIVAEISAIMARNQEWPGGFFQQRTQTCIFALLCRWLRQLQITWRT